ncbi:MAG: hypothetical protein OSJ72_06165 [Lachnospiraceae bacterium]|nr:hypothetical protein [Lachnospiraceae bacterium]
MKKIMFLYHVKEREYEIIERIKLQILSYSNDVEIRIGEFYASIKNVIEFRPDVVVSIPPRDCYSSNYLTMIKLLTKAVIISMTTEGNHGFDNSVVQDVIGYNTYSPRLVDYYIMWGSKTGKILGKKLLETNKVSDRKRIKVAGYVFYEVEGIKAIYEKHPEYDKIVGWIKNYARKVLVLTGFSQADWKVQDYFYLGFFGDQRSHSKVSGEQIENVLKIKERFMRFREKYISDVIAAAERLPDIGFVVKLHPVEVNSRTRYYDRLSEYSNIYVVSVAFPVGALLPEVDVMVHYNSTTNFEAYIYGVPTIYRYEGTEENLKSYLEESTYSYSLDAREDFIRCIKGKCEFKRLPRIEKKLFELFNWRIDRQYKPVEKIAAYVYHARKSQSISIFEEELFKAAISKEGKDIEKWILFKLLAGKTGWKTMYILSALMKIQFIKTLGQIRRIEMKK